MEVAEGDENEKNAIKWGQQSEYTIASKLGRGKYSHVFLGYSSRLRQKVAIKTLTPIRREKILREYTIHSQLHHPNIIQLLDTIRHPQLRTASFVFQHFENEDFRQLYPKLTLSDIRCYIMQLLQALEYLHARGIFHRDIKPFNVLIEAKSRRVKVIDFGQAAYYNPQQEASTKVGSLYYKAPQLLLNNGKYDCRVDCWAVGLILLSMISKRTPCIMGTDLADQIFKVVKIVGTQETIRYICENKLTERKENVRENICADILMALKNKQLKNYPASNFTEYIDATNAPLFTQQAVSLIKGLLAIDHKLRLTAADALRHPFFNTK